MALAKYNDGTAMVEDVTLGARNRPAEAIVTEWLHRDQESRLLAIDAPLGWPAPLSTALAAHRAGERVDPARIMT